MIHRPFAWFRADRRGAISLEYGLIAAMIATTIVLGFARLAEALSAEFALIASKL